jgi:uncharacterized protein YjiS (DUF1127 family)
VIWTMTALERVVAALWQTARGGLSGEAKRMWSITSVLSWRRRGLARIAGRICHLIVVLELALDVRRERRMLLRMDDRALKDFGCNRGEAHAEAQRPLWDIPRARLRSGALSPGHWAAWRRRGDAPDPP